MSSTPSLSPSIYTTAVVPDNGTDEVGNVASNGLLVANWPTAVPPSTAKYALSIMMGNTSWNWALHDGSDQDFAPSAFWSNSVVVGRDSKVTLAKLIPSQFHELLFGSIDFTNKTGSTYRLSLRVPTLHVFVVSTNVDHEPYLFNLFRKLPCLLYKLSSDDFMFPANSVYPGIGVDRLVNMAAAQYLYRDARSVLVIDGGTAMTYTTIVSTANTAAATATAATGETTPAAYQMAGGIGAGLRLKLQSLHDYTDDLPLVDHVMLTRLVGELTESQAGPLSIFPKAMVPAAATTTTSTAATEELILDNDDSVARAIVGSILTETALLLSCVVQSWLKLLGKTASESTTTEPTRVTQLPVVVITGGDGSVYHKLLQPKHSFICETHAVNTALLETGLTLPTLDQFGITAVMPETDDETTKAFRLQEHRCLPHIGIQHVLLSHRLYDDAVRETVCTQMIGQRVTVRDAKRNVHGFVAEVVRGSNIDQDYFSVSYDDSARIDDLDSVELYAALQLYTKSGEKTKPRDEDHKIRVLNKVKDAKEAMALLEEHSIAVRKSLEPSTPLPPPATVAAAAAEKDVVAVHSPSVAVDGGRRLSDAPEKEPTAKRKKPAPPLAPVTERDPKALVGERVAKYFELDGEQVVFFGTVSEYVVDDDESWWHVVYDDDDTEDLEAPALNEAIDLYESIKQTDPKKSNNF